MSESNLTSTSTEIQYEGLPDNLHDFGFLQFIEFMQNNIVSNLYSYYKFKAVEDSSLREEYKVEVVRQMKDLGKINQIYYKRIANQKDLYDGENKVGLIEDLAKERKIRLRMYVNHIGFGIISLVSMPFLGKTLFPRVRFFKTIYTLGYLVPYLASCFIKHKYHYFKIEEMILKHSLDKTALVEPGFKESFIKDYFKVRKGEKLL